MTVKVEKGIKPKRKRTSKSRFPFDEMKPGDSFYYEGHRNSAIISYGYYRIKGEITTEAEGKGWRFHLLKKE